MSKWKTWFDKVFKTWWQCCGYCLHHHCRLFSGIVCRLLIRKKDSIIFNHNQALKTHRKNESFVMIWYCSTFTISFCYCVTETKYLYSLFAMNWHSFAVLKGTINWIIFAITIAHWRIHVTGSIIITIIWSKHIVHGMLTAA